MVEIPLYCKFVLKSNIKAYKKYTQNMVCKFSPKLQNTSQTRHSCTLISPGFGEYTVYIYECMCVHMVVTLNMFFFSGLIVGAILRYSGDSTSLSHIRVTEVTGQAYNENAPPDTLWLVYAHGESLYLLDAPFFFSKMMLNLS